MTTTRETADHAELARDIRALCSGHPHAKIAWPHRELHDVADRVETLLSEIAALRGEAGDLKRHRDRLAITCQRRLDDWRSAQAQVTQAERQRDELRKALGRQCDNMSFVLSRVELHAWAGKFSREVGEDRALLANQGAGQ